MTKRRAKPLNLDGQLYLTYTGMETDLMFTQGVDLPGFASYPLLETPSGRELLTQYYTDFIKLGQRENLGIILESPTWVANRDRGAELGYSSKQLQQLNIQAVDFMDQIRAPFASAPILISVNVGPRADAYAPAEQMSETEAEHYHWEQISALEGTKTDCISGYTLAYTQEAIGISHAAKRANLPVVIAFTVETDGRLPTGTSLQQAIETVDRATEAYPSYYMINCAHPDHFQNILSDAPWMNRLKGIVANASRCSHAELDEATELDAGNPTELGQQLAEFHRSYPNINILGGCCGTDMRHITCIAQAIT